MADMFHFPLFPHVARMRAEGLSDEAIAKRLGDPPGLSVEALAALLAKEGKS